MESPFQQLILRVRELAHDAPEQAPGLLDEVLAFPQDEHEDGAERDVAVIEMLAERLMGEALLRLISLSTLEELAQRCIARLRADADPALDTRRSTHKLLDVLRRSTLLCRIAEAGTTEQWAQTILSLVELSHFTVGQLFSQRCESLGARPLFQVPRQRGPQAVSWRRAASQIDLYARGLLAGVGPQPVRRLAVLSHNRLEVALLDLACLSSGIVNVVIPATATEHDVAYILEHAEVDTAVVSNRKQLSKVLKAREHLPTLKTIFAIDADAATARGVLKLDQLFELATGLPQEELLAQREAVRIDALATIMYTSGTTGTPKGICFSQRNIVFKRFARALALPEIGEEDRFLAYLPLFHTFGRFLEMMGCVFWGATYCFAESPAIETLSRQMRELEATVFISIPMKWIELYELVKQKVDVEGASQEEIRSAFELVCGNKLRWGLSAAGYLDPEIFRFFQRNDVELMSGFGMTEATGGITMTPPGRYQDDSLGGALPGIELRLAEDGELMIRGPYVMMGYHAPAAEQPAAFDEQGWFHSGDIMESDEDGFIRLVDRKKEIYKNVKGQTIAPQKIENLFRDFPLIGRVFLVGDHRAYNTALIYPNPHCEEVDVGKLSPGELKDHLRSAVVSANAFLAPYERIVDFAVIDRDFDAEQGELTPKNTYRRKNIERNFIEVVRELYRRATIQTAHADVTVPNWLVQALGITTTGLQIDGDHLLLTELGTKLLIKRTTDETVLVGSTRYQHPRKAVSLGFLLSDPRLWLGNEQLVAFAPLDMTIRNRRRKRTLQVEWLGPVTPHQTSEAERSTAQALLSKADIELLDLHLAAMLLQAERVQDAIVAIRVLEHALDVDTGGVAEAARHVLRRASFCPEQEVRGRAFQVLVASETTARYRQTLAAFLSGPSSALDADTIAVLVQRNLSIEQIDAFIAVTEQRCAAAIDSPEQLPSAVTLLDFLAEYGAAHPTRYRPLRAFFTRVSMLADSPQVRSAASDARQRMEDGFRSWLGTPRRVAVDPETTLEYRWEDVVAFSDDVDREAQQRILGAIRNTAMLAEGAFLFAGGATIRLEDILPSGVWIRLLGSSRGKSVYRVAIKTRLREQLDLAVNLNRSLSAAEVAEEINWLIICAEAGERRPLVEDFGGYWDDYGLWTEEFIPGQTLDRALKRLSHKPSDETWFTGVWPFAAWSALSTYVDFWNRTGRRFVVSMPTPARVIVPMHDYHVGSRLVSISEREPFQSLGALLQTLRDQFVARVETEHPRLRKLVEWSIIFSAVLEAVGESEGKALLEEAQSEELVATNTEMATALERFLRSVRELGFLPLRLFFAAERYRRWEQLNPSATHAARASTVHQLYKSYGLAGLQDSYPEARTRFFRETVFRDASTPLAEGLEDVVAKLRRHELAPDELSVGIADLRAHLKLDTAEDYFLARLSYPHLKPEDEASYVAAGAGGTQLSEMVVTVQDKEGRPFHIRHALSPKEIAKLHRLFLTAKLPVHFRPEHRFLVAIGVRGHIIGGLFYEENAEARTAHMEKIAVVERIRGQGIAHALLEELCNRLENAGYRALTTGFFRPQFFYRYGFTVERHYAGLVRSFEKPEPEQS